MNRHTRLMMYAGCLLLIAGAIAAEPLLIAVHLADRPTMRLWASVDQKTFLYVEDTAIAEIESDVLTELVAAGLSAEILDPPSGLESLYEISLSSDLLDALPGVTLWAKNRTALVKKDAVGRFVTSAGEADTINH